MTFLVCFFPIDLYGFLSRVFPFSVILVVTKIGRVDMRRYFTIGDEKQCDQHRQTQSAS